MKYEKITEHVIIHLKFAWSCKFSLAHNILASCARDQAQEIVGRLGRSVSPLSPGEAWHVATLAKQQSVYIWNPCH